MQNNISKKAVSTPSGKRDLYQQYDVQEQIDRISYHYEVEPRFFELITGGKWHTYSCSFWEKAKSMTEAQEYKLDLYAQNMELKKGMRILDVGCGWGGPLVYLCKTYNVEGLGITISPTQIPYAQKRASRHNVNAKFIEMHWENMPENNQFDAIFTDEVIVHFEDLQGFFKKCRKLLKPGGKLVNKELHFVHSEHAHARDKLSQHINGVYAYTGNYRTLADELSLLDSTGFVLSNVQSFSIDNYHKTIYEHWLKAVREHKKELISMTSEEHVRDFKIYLRGIAKIFARDVFGLHMVSARNPE